jgi:organic hydroperoxide reductase OsmC/OhrA
MASSEREPLTVRLRRESGYRFVVDFPGDAPPLGVDEPPPLGAGSGPNPSALLGAAIADCLSASLVYCLERAHLEVGDVEAEARVHFTRNAAGRLRVGSVDVRLSPEIHAAPGGRADRCLELFEDFCVVTESVRSGIEVALSVEPAWSEPPQSGR